MMMMMKMKMNFFPHRNSNHHAQTRQYPACMQAKTKKIPPPTHFSGLVVLVHSRPEDLPLRYGAHMRPAYEEPHGDLQRRCRARDPQDRRALDGGSDVDLCGFLYMESVLLNFLFSVSFFSFLLF